MERSAAVALSTVALLLPIVVSYLLRPTPEHNSHAMMWLSGMVVALLVSGALWLAAARLGYSSFKDLPTPRPPHRKLELGFIALPPILLVAIILWQVLRTAT